MRKSILTIFLSRMRILLLVAALCLLGNTWTNELQAQIVKRQYKVQVGAYQNLKFVDKTGLSKLGNVYVENGSDGIHRVILGYYADRATADAILAQAIAAGYRDAFVSFIDTTIAASPAPEQMSVVTPVPQPVPVPQSVPVPVQPVPQPVDIFTPPPVQQQPVMVPTPVPTPTQVVVPTQPVVPTLSGDEVFAINLGTYARPVKIPVLGAVGQLGQIFKRQDNAQQTTVFFGHFTNYQEAQRAFNLLKMQAGYTNVRLVKVDKISLQELALNIAVPQKPTTYTKTTPTPVVTQPQSVPAPLTNVVNSTNVPLVSTTPAATTTAHPSIQHFEQFKGLFAGANFNLFMVDIYDPTQEGVTGATVQSSAVAINQSLKGTAIPASLYYLFDRLPNRDPQLVHYALYQYPLNNTIDAYVIRSGKGLYHQDNYAQLYLFDKTANRFVAKELLSHITQTNAAYTKIKSWIVDLDQNGSFDLLTYTLVEPANGVAQAGKLSAKVWQNGQFIVANIGDEAEFKRKLGLK